MTIRPRTIIALTAFLMAASAYGVFHRGSLGAEDPSDLTSLRTAIESTRQEQFNQWRETVQTSAGTYQATTTISDDPDCPVATKLPVRIVPANRPQELGFIGTAIADHQIVLKIVTAQADGFGVDPMRDSHGVAWSGLITVREGQPATLVLTRPETGNRLTATLARLGPLPQQP